MSDKPNRLTDDLIGQFMRTRSADPDFGMLDEIVRALEETPQNRRSLRVGPMLLPRRALLFVVLALLLAAAGAIAVGARFLLPDPRAFVPMANGWIAYPLGQEDNPGANRADIYLTSLDGTPRRIIGRPGDGIPQSCPAFSPDGTLLAYGERADFTHEAAVVIVELDANGTPSPRLRVPAGTMSEQPCPKWSPDGRSVALLSGDSAELRLAPLAGSPTSLRLPCDLIIGCPQAFPHAFAWTWDSSALVFADFDSLRLVPLDGSEPRILAQAASESFDGVSASPVGPTLAVRGEGGTGQPGSAFVRVLDMNSARVILEQTFAVGGSIDAPVWSPDGTRIAWTSRDGLFVQALDGTPAVVHETEWAQQGARPSVGIASGVVWSPDGRRLLFLGGSDDGFAIVSIAADGPADVRVLTPWSMGFERAQVGDLSWQAVDP